MSVTYEATEMTAWYHLLPHDVFGYMAALTCGTLGPLGAAQRSTPYSSLRLSQDL